MVPMVMGDAVGSIETRGTPIDFSHGREWSSSAASASSSSSVETLPERTSNYFATYDETELFDALREQTVVLALLVPHCDLCRHYAEEFRYVAQLFGEAEGEAGGGGATPRSAVAGGVASATGRGGVVARRSRGCVRARPFAILAGGACAGRAVMVRPRSLAAVCADVASRRASPRG